MSSRQRPTPPRPTDVRRAPGTGGLEAPHSAQGGDGPPSAPASSDALRRSSHEVVARALDEALVDLAPGGTGATRGGFESLEELDPAVIAELAARASGTRGHDSGPLHPDEAARWVGTVVAERYRIDALLGVGGMGAVYRAEHVHMRKAVALKLLHRQTTAIPEAVERFRREAVAAARIQHPAVAAALDFSELPDGTCYLVLEYVPGRALSEELALGPLHPERAVQIARAVADGLAAAHAAGVVHRDLKPENVMLAATEDGSLSVKILDFGIARVHLDADSGTPLTRQGAVFGTPDYMAPEQASGAPADHRADLYALGITLLEMLLGANPFRGTTLTATLTAQLTQAPPTLPDPLPPELDRVVQSLLQKHPDDRPAAAAAVRDQLDHILATGMLAGLPAFDGKQMPSTHSLLEVMASNAARSTQASVVGQGPAAPAGMRPWHWVLAAVSVAAIAGATAVIVALVSAEPRPTEAGGGPSSAAASASGAPSGGASASLASIQGRDASARTRDEWIALAQGLAGDGQLPAAAAELRSAAEHVPDLGADPRVLAVLRRLLRDPELREQATQLVPQLGGLAADLLYDEWDRARGEGRSADAKRLRESLDRPPIHAASTPALRVALELWDARSCEQRAVLMDRLEQHGDQRSMGIMKTMQASDGCGGKRARYDCWACLRARFDATIAAVRARPAPVLPDPPAPQPVVTP